MSPSDGTGRPAPSEAAYATIRALSFTERLEFLLNGDTSQTMRVALDAAYAADVGLVSRADFNAQSNAAMALGEQAAEARAERDELRARLTVVEAERDGAKEDVRTALSAAADWHELHGTPLAYIEQALGSAGAAYAANAFHEEVKRADEAEAALAACREQNTTLREALEAIRAYAVADEPHYDAHRWTTCGEGPCLACLIHSTAETALASVRPAGSTDNENGDEER